MKVSYVKPYFPKDIKRNHLTINTRILYKKCKLYIQLPLSKVVDVCNNTLMVEFTKDDSHMHQFISMLHVYIQMNSKYTGCNFINPIKNGVMKLLMNNSTIIFDENKENKDYIDRKVKYIKLIVSPEYIWKSGDYVGVHISVCQVQTISDEKCFSFIEIVSPPPPPPMPPMGALKPPPPLPLPMQYQTSAAAGRAATCPEPPCRIGDQRSETASCPCPLRARLHAAPVCLGAALAS